MRRLTAIFLILHCGVVLRADEPAPPPPPAVKPRIALPALRLVPALANTAPQVAAAQRRLESLPAGGKYRLDDLLRLSCARGELEIARGPAAPLIGSFVIEVEERPGPWIATWYARNVVGAPPTTSLSLMRYDFEQADGAGPWTMSLSASDLSTSMSVQFGSGSAVQYVSISLVNGIRATIMPRQADANGVRKSTVLTAPNLLELRSQRPAEFRQYIAPALRRLLGDDLLVVKPGDVYRVFDDIPADPQTTARLRALLPQLDSPSADDRLNATKALHALGPEGVLAAMRLDRSNIPPEPAARLSGFIAAHDEQRIADPARGRTDVQFLLDCLEYRDPAVRSRAITLLTEQVKDFPKIDPNAPAEERARAADQVRERLAKPADAVPAK